MSLRRVLLSRNVALPRNASLRQLYAPPRLSALHSQGYTHPAARHVHVRALTFSSVPKAALRAFRLPAYAAGAGAGALAYANYKVDGELSLVLCIKQLCSD